MREFIDTNVLVYAFDASSGLRHEVARKLVERLWEDGTGCLSVQVLQEFYAIVTRKVAVPLSLDEASDRIRELTVWTVFSASAGDVLAAIALQKKMQIQFWDALIIHAAGELACDVIWTEDLNHNQVVGGVRVLNPFVSV